MEQNVTKNQEQLEGTATQVFNAALPDNNQEGKVSTAGAVDANSMEGEGERYSLTTAEKNMIRSAENLRDRYFIQCLRGSCADAQYFAKAEYLREYKNVLTKLGPKNARLFSRVFRGLFRDGIFPTLDSVRSRRAEIVETMKAERTAREIQAKADKIAKLAESLGTTPEAIQAALKLGVINLK